MDEEALYLALEKGAIAGAGLDVFGQEPFNLKREEKLASLNQVIMTAHIGSCTKTGRYQMELGAARAVVKQLEGKKPPHIVNGL